MLEGEAERSTEALDETGERGAFFTHFDKDLAGATIFKQTNREIALVVGDGELMSEAASRCGQAFTAKRRCSGHGRAIGTVDATAGNLRLNGFRCRILGTICALGSVVWCLAISRFVAILSPLLTLRLLDEFTLVVELHLFHFISE